jgi:hypothetical protein
MINRDEQRTDAWLKSRVGKITGSEVGKLMTGSRKKDEYFGKTAKAYIYKKAAERSLDKDVLEDNDLWELYQNQYSVSSKAMDFGTNQEPFARDRYRDETGYSVEEIGSCAHPTIPFFASSPDGYVDTGSEKGCIEIKVPNPDTYFMYISEIKSGDDLLDVNPDYYYQCQAHIMCTESAWTDFVCFQPFLTNQIHIVRINPNEDVIKQMTERIIKANEYIEELIS